jgi:hypothetical protein
VTEAARPAHSGIETIIPVLRVESLNRSTEYYVGALGFVVDWEYGGMVSVSRDGHALMLCQGAQGNPGTWVWVGVHDAGALYDEFVAAGARITMQPVNLPWAYEFNVGDPDGHILRFGSEPREDLPLVQPGGP